VGLDPEEKKANAANFLQWFVDDRLEEISGAETRLSVIRRAGPSVFMVEAYLSHDSK
jgi:ferritin